MCIIILIVLYCTCIVSVRATRRLYLKYVRIFCTYICMYVCMHTHVIMNPFVYKPKNELSGIEWMKSSIQIFITVITVITVNTAQEGRAGQGRAGQDMI